MDVLLIMFVVCLEFCVLWLFCYHVVTCADEPSTSGLQETDYPVLADDRIGLSALREIGSVKRLPLPAELAERFACILHWQLLVVLVTVNQW